MVNCFQCYIYNTLFGNDPSIGSNPSKDQVCVFHKKNRFKLKKPVFKIDFKNEKLITTQFWNQNKIIVIIKRKNKKMSKNKSRFIEGKTYTISADIVSILLDPQNINDPHPMFKQDAEKAILSKGSVFTVEKILEIKKNDEWPICKNDDVEMEVTDSYTLLVDVKKTGKAGAFLSNAMLEREEIEEVVWVIWNGWINKQSY